MSVATELTKLNTNIKNAYDEIATKGGTIPQNKNTDNLATAISSISGGGGGADEYFETSGGLTNVQSTIKKSPGFTTTANNLSSCFSGCSNLKEVGNITSTATNINVNVGQMFYNCSQLTTIGTLSFSGKLTPTSFMFAGCYVLKSVPVLDTQYSVNCSQMFYNCRALENVPVYNLASCVSIQNMFFNCQKLTTQSLDNILQSFISATSYTGTKTLAQAGFNNTYMPSATIQTLPHYQDFINAGWTIGY